MIHVHALDKWMLFYQGSDSCQFWAKRTHTSQFIVTDTDQTRKWLWPFGDCYSHEWNIRIILQQLWPEIQSAGYLPTLKDNYYSFKIFPRFCLVKTTRIIHHNQLLFTKFGKNLRQIESMTSKVQHAADYWTIDWENLGTRLCYFWWAEKQRANGKTL